MIKRRSGPCLYRAVFTTDHEQVVEVELRHGSALDRLIHKAVKNKSGQATVLLGDLRARRLKS